MSLTNSIQTARPNVPIADDFLLYRETVNGLYQWIVAMFNPTCPSDCVRFVFLTRADAAQAIWKELGIPYSLPVVFMLKRRRTD